ncbi:MAG: hypothetical protein ACYTG4_03895 [Planctomycetota bacterium]|jgi:hypothetical protein
MARELTNEELGWLVAGIDFLEENGAAAAPGLLGAWRDATSGFRVQVDSADWDLDSFLTSFVAPADCEPKSLADHGKYHHYSEGLQVVVDRATRRVMSAGIWNVCC